MVPILPVDFAVKPKANNSKSQEFSMWETVIFLLLKAAVLPCWEQRQRCLGTCPVKHWRKMTQSILKTCVLSLQLSFNVPFDKLSRRKVSRLCFYGQPCHATRSRPLTGSHGVRKGRWVRSWCRSGCKGRKQMQVVVTVLFEVLVWGSQKSSIPAGKSFRTDKKVISTVFIKKMCTLSREISSGLFMCS